MGRNSKILIVYQPLLKKSVMQEPNMWAMAKSAIHVGQVAVDEGIFRSNYVNDGIFRHPHVVYYSWDQLKPRRENRKIRYGNKIEKPKEHKG
jgi:hypothetical protein